MSVQTANVIVATSKEAIQKLFSLGNISKNLIDEISTDGDILLFNKQSNPNFISFKHGFGLNTDQTATLTFIDPDNEFEKRYIENEPININTKTKYFYLAYGIGSNLDSWAGPLRFTLVGADYTIDGSKKITLKLAPSPNTLDFTGPFSELVDFNLFGNTLNIKGKSKQIRTDKIVSKGIKEKVYSPFDHGIKKGSTYPYELANFEKALNSLQEDTAGINFYKELDFHNLVVDAFREFLKSIFNTNNVIVLLPNLNLLCAPRLKKIFDANFQNNPLLSDSLPAFLNSIISMLTCNWETQDTQKFLTGVDNEALSSPFGQSDLSNQGEFNLNKKRHLLVQNWCQFTARFKEKIENTTRINSFIDSIRSCSYSDYGIKLVQFIECNPDLTDYWVSLSKNNLLFGGYTDLTPDEEVIVIGDYNLIKEFLYHKSSYALDKVKKARKDLKENIKKQKNIEVFKKQSIPALVKEVASLAEEYRDINKKIYTSIPLHPLDASYISNVDYKEKVKEILGKRDNTFDPFGTTTSFPDEFAYKQFGKKEKTYIEENQIPLFKYNTTNPNVVKLTHKNNEAYFSQLNIGYANTIERAQTASKNKDLTFYPKPITTVDQALAYLISKGYSQGLSEKEKKEILDSLVGKIDSSDLGSMNTDAVALAKSSIKVLELIEQNDNKTFITLKQFTPGSSFAIFTNFLTNLYKTSKQVSIKTIPLFHIMRTPALQQPCVLLAQDSPVLGSNLEERSLLNTFISGIYSIIGFSNTIDSRGASSEFQLIKQFSNIEVE